MTHRGTQGFRGAGVSPAILQDMRTGKIAGETPAPLTSHTKFIELDGFQAMDL
jgi:hypothetical protein